MGMSLKEGEAYAALRDAVASQIQEMKALQGPSHHPSNLVALLPFASEGLLGEPRSS